MKHDPNKIKKKRKENINLLIRSKINKNIIEEKYF